jgi:hypothetical protein
MKRTYSVTVEAYGRVTTRRYVATSRADAEQQALKAVAFRVKSSEVVAK